MIEDSSVSIEHGGFTIESSGGGYSNQDALKASFTEIQAATKGNGSAGDQDPDGDEEGVAKEAAKTLGARGGKAKAKKALKAKPIKELPSPEVEDPQANANDDPASLEPKDDEGEEDEGEAARKRVAKEIQEAPRGQRKRLASERVAEATRDAAAAKREAAAAKRELDSVRRQFEALSAPTQPPGPAPDRGRYSGRDDEYIDARIQHGIQEALSRHQSQTRATAVQTERNAWATDAANRFVASLTRARRADPEVDSKVWSELADIPPHYELGPDEAVGAENFVMTEIMASDDPFSLVLYLSENQEEFTRLRNLNTPRQITREMARIEEKVSAMTGQPAPSPSKGNGFDEDSDDPVSEAPPPVQPVPGAPHSAESGYRPGMSFSEYLRTQKLGRALLKRNRGGR